MQPIEGFFILRRPITHLRDIANARIKRFQDLGIDPQLAIIKEEFTVSGQWMFLAVWYYQEAPDAPTG